MHVFNTRIRPQARDGAAARAAWDAARAAIHRFARLVNTRAPPELVPLNERGPRHTPARPGPARPRTALTWRDPGGPGRYGTGPGPGRAGWGDLAGTRGPCAGPWA